MTTAASPTPTGLPAQSASAGAALPALQTALHALRQGSLSAHAFSQQARAPQALLDGLPPRFGEVWLALLDRLEASALFSEESCSFSQRELLDSLQLWLDKAGARLHVAQGAGGASH